MPRKRRKCHRRNRKTQFFAIYFPVQLLFFLISATVLYIGLSLRLIRLAICDYFFMNKHHPSSNISAKRLLLDLQSLERRREGAQAFFVAKLIEGEIDVPEIMVRPSTQG